MNSLQNRAVIVTKHGGIDVLDVAAWPVSAPAEGQLQVRVAASGVNFMDAYSRQGIYPAPSPIPFVLGVEGAGEVIAIGSSTEPAAEFKVGDRVAWVSSPGSHADIVNISAARAVPVPDSVTLELAAAVMLQGMTAHYLVNSTYPVQPGDSILVHAAAGGVGQLLVQLGQRAGARVIGTVGTAAKREKALALGADVVLRYDEIDDLAAAVREANYGGVDVAYDGVGRSTFEASLASLLPRGMLVLFGASSGQVPPFDLQRLNPAGSLFVTRPMLAHYVATREELLWRANAVFHALADGSLRVEIGGRYSRADAARAYHDLETRATTGKLIFVD